MSMVTPKSWKEFKNTGLLLIINQILHKFGWAIITEIGSDGEILVVYPARVKFRGFDNKSVSIAYNKVSEYLAKNIEELKRDANK